MTFKETIDDMRGTFTKEKYEIMFRKLLEMYNNDETINLVGRMSTINKKLQTTFFSKRIEKETYLLVFTKDATLYGNYEAFCESDKDNQVAFYEVKVKKLFNYLLNNKEYDGCVLNDCDGEGDVLIPTTIIQATFDLQ